jgi:hypothetical protein
VVAALLGPSDHGAADGLSGPWSCGTRTCPFARRLDRRGPAGAGRLRLRFRDVGRRAHPDDRTGREADALGDGGSLAHAGCVVGALLDVCAGFDVPAGVVGTSSVHLVIHHAHAKQRTVATVPPDGHGLGAAADVEAGRGAHLRRGKQ